MSEAKKPAPAAGEKKAKKGPSASEMLSADKKTKVSWSLERCQKAARRFGSEKEWAAGAPAAYKSAVAHGWIAQCTSQMKGAKTTARKTA